VNDQSLRARFWQVYLITAATVSLGVGYWVGSTLLGSGQPVAATVPPAKPTSVVVRRAEQSAPNRVEPVAAVAAANAKTADSVAPPRPVDAEALALSQLAIGRDLLAVGDLEGGYLAYRSAVELHQSAETHAALGGLYFRIAARNDAYVQFRKAVELDPYNADLWLDLANAEHMRTALGYEWKAVKRAKEVDPEIQIARDASGYYFRDQNDPKAFTSSGSYTLRRIP